MSLTLVAVPIGHPKDISLRALDTLKSAQIIVGEERKPLFRLLKSLGLEKPNHYELLNEHSRNEDLTPLVDLCATHSVALVTDCGTPGFCDPGADLVHLCRTRGISVTSNPGPCSLTVFLSLCGQKLDQFYFAGFLPRETELRLKTLKKLDLQNRPYIFMDTPYRLEKTLLACHQINKSRSIILGTELTQPDERILSGPISKILPQIKGWKKEFIALIQ